MGALQVERLMGWKTHQPWDKEKIKVDGRVKVERLIDLKIHQPLPISLFRTHQPLF
jgi:hypothetical protein